MYLQEIQSKPADGVESSTPLTSQEYQELQQLRAMIPELLAKIDELWVQLTNLRKKREESEAESKHTLLRMETIETELSTSFAQITSIHEWYRDRDERIFHMLVECAECLYGRESGAVNDGVSPSLDEVLRLKLLSLFDAAKAYFGNSDTPVLSLRRHTSDNSFTHSAEQPIPIPPPGSNIGSAIAHTNHPAAPPASRSSAAITPSNQMEDEALGDIGGQ